MLAKQNPVTAHYWKLMHEYIGNRLRCCPLVRVNRRVWRIDSGSKRKIYLAFSRQGDPIAWLYLHRRSGWAAWEVWQSWVFPEHRGKGLGTRLYQAVINDDRLLLSSGNIHSHYSRLVWRSFIKKKLFNIWAQDFKNLDRTSTVDYDRIDDEIDCDLDIYDYQTSYENFFFKHRPTDVRLLATRNKHESKRVHR